MAIKDEITLRWHLTPSPEKEEEWVGSSERSVEEVIEYLVIDTLIKLRCFCKSTASIVPPFLRDQEGELQNNLYALRIEDVPMDREESVCEQIETLFADANIEEQERPSPFAETLYFEVTISHEEAEQNSTDELISKLESEVQQALERCNVPSQVYVDYGDDKRMFYLQISDISPGDVITVETATIELFPPDSCETMSEYDWSEVTGEETNEREGEEWNPDYEEYSEEHWNSDE